MQETRMRSEKKERMEELAIEIGAEDRRNEAMLETLMKKLNDIEERIARIEAVKGSEKEQPPEANHASK